MVCQPLSSGILLRPLALTVNTHSSRYSRLIQPPRRGCSKRKKNFRIVSLLLVSVRDFTIKLTLKLTFSIIIPCIPSDEHILVFVPWSQRTHFVFSNHIKSRLLPCLLPLNNFSHHTHLDFPNDSFFFISFFLSNSYPSAGEKIPITEFASISSPFI